MRLKIMAIWDEKAKAYLQCTFHKTQGEAVRSWIDAVNEEKTASGHQSNFFKHAEDFTLFEIGEYDDNTGELKSHPTKIPLGNGLEMQDKKPPQRLPNREERRQQA